MNVLRKDTIMADQNINASENAQNTQETTQQNSTNNDQSKAENTAQAAQDDSKKEVDFEKLIQKAVDRATNKLGNENKKLREQLETIKKEKLSDEELKKLELADKEADIADREAKLAEKENRLFAIKAIKEAGLDDGSDTALELVDFVMSGDEDTTRAKVKVFSQLVNKMVAAKVAETFKNNGRNPEKGGTGKGTENSVAAKIGEISAQRNEAANKVLSHYLGGK